MHLFLQNFDDYVEFAENGLDSLVATLLVLQKLLHIFKCMPQFRLVDQTQFIKFFENACHVVVNGAHIELYLIVALLDKTMKLIAHLLLIDGLLFAPDIRIKLFDFPEKLLKILLNFPQFSYFGSVNPPFLTHSGTRLVFMSVEIHHRSLNVQPKVFLNSLVLVWCAIGRLLGDGQKSYLQRVFLVFLRPIYHHIVR